MCFRVKSYNAWNVIYKICKIGKDVILVELNPMNNPQIAAQSTTTDSKNNEEQTQDIPTN